MKPLGQLLIACLASLAGYFLLFGFVVSRPLVVNTNGEMFDAKIAYVAGARSPKMAIIAGSNGRFSHSCAVMEKRFGRPCANLSVSADVGLDWITDQARRYLGRGDIVYLPLEYSFYSKSRQTIYTGSDAAYRFRYDKSGLLGRGAEGAVRAMFMFDVGTLVQSVGEMGLHAAGIHRRAGAADINVQGDEIHHGDLEAAPYADLVRHMSYGPVVQSGLMDNPDGAQAILVDFLEWCHANGVIAVGGLPTSFDDVPVPDSVVATLSAFYHSHGAQFVALPNRSLYPRADFFDTPEHLRDGVQIAHTKKVAAALDPIWRPVIAGATSRP